MFSKYGCTGVIWSLDLTHQSQEFGHVSMFAGNSPDYTRRLDGVLSLAPVSPMILPFLAAEGLALTARVKGLLGLTNHDTR
jgi:hypothetical protein